MVINTVPPLYEPEVIQRNGRCRSIRAPVCQSDRMINPRPSVELVRSPRLASRASYAYAAVAPAALRLIFTAGACPLDESGAILEVGDVAGQAERTMTNLRIALQAADVDLPVTEDNVKIRRRQNDISIDVDYVVPIEFPGYTYTWHINHHAENPIF